MKKIGAFFKLVRWPNLLMTALMMCLVYHCVMGVRSTVGFILLTISVVFIFAGGYAINDIFDKDIDAVNKPDRLIVGRIFTEKQCNIYYWSLTIIGLACALASSLITYGSKFLPVFLCLLLLVCVFYSYSSRYKKRLVVGNVIVSLSIAFVTFLPWLFQIMAMRSNEMVLIENEEWMHQSLHLVLVYTAFAFLLTLIREIVKDMEDVEGDERSHCRTIPIAWGIKAAQIIVLVLSVLAFVMIMFAKEYLYDLGFKVTSYMLNASGVFMFIMVLGGNIFGLLDASFRTSKQFHMQSIAMKISMLIGVLSMFFII